MLFVRGIMGDVKLNPAIKLWGGFLLVVLLSSGGLAYRIIEYERAMAACQKEDGVWIGGNPAGLGRLSGVLLHKGKCEPRHKQATAK